MKTEYKKLIKKSESRISEYNAYFKKLKKRDKKSLDKDFHALHTEVFKVINCLECGNCCRTIGPRITDNDIERMSKAMRIRPSDFVKLYLKKDEDKDWIFKNMPCPFIDSENYCLMYEHRPKACREYPHTDRKNIYQILDLTLLNSSVCPAVSFVIEKLIIIKN